MSEDSCNLGYSDGVKAAIANACRRHGEVVSTSADAFISLQLGGWTLRTWPSMEGMTSWMQNYSLKRDSDDVTCGQCASCSAMTPDRINRTAMNLPYMEPEEAHHLEDAIMRWALRLASDGGQFNQEIAHAAYMMAAQKRTRWFA